MKIIFNILLLLLSLNISAQIIETKLAASSSGWIDNISYYTNVRTNDPSQIREEIVLSINMRESEKKFYKESFKDYRDNNLPAYLHFEKGSRNLTDFIEILNRMIKFSQTESTEILKLESNDSYRDKYILTSSRGKEYFYVKIEVQTDTFVTAYMTELGTFKKLLEVIKKL